MSTVYEVESNDTMALANRINSDDDAYGFISTTSDVDWFKFTLNQKGYINLYLGSIPPDTDYDLYLYNSSGILIWEGLNYSNNSELLLNKLLSAGDYNVKVKPYYGASTTDSYHLRWRLIKIWPVFESERITQYFQDELHLGIDIGGSTPGVPGDTIVAFYDGIVTRAEWSSSYGWVVYISHEIDGKKIQSRYAHLHERPIVSVNDILIAGQQVGIMGNTGQSSGVHLHFETRECGTSCDNTNNSTPVNPLNYFPEYA